jgi:hypothetical protein
MQSMSMAQYIQLTSTNYDDVLEVVKELSVRDLVTDNMKFFYECHRDINFVELADLMQIFDIVLEYGARVVFKPNKYFWKFRKDYLTKMGLSDIII